jgi:hypothetical protein
MARRSEDRKKRWSHGNATGIAAHRRITASAVRNRHPVRIAEWKRTRRSPQENRANALAGEAAHAAPQERTDGSRPGVPSGVLDRGRGLQVPALPSGGASSQGPLATAMIGSPLPTAYRYAGHARWVRRQPRKGRPWIIFLDETETNNAFPDYSDRIAMVLARDRRVERCMSA